MIIPKPYSFLSREKKKKKSVFPKEYFMLQTLLLKPKTLNG